MYTPYAENENLIEKGHYEIKKQYNSIITKNHQGNLWGIHNECAVEYAMVMNMNGWRKEMETSQTIAQ
jgi:hypothetical protein